MVYGMGKLTLQQEVRLLRSAVAGLVGRDREGQYRPEFVEEILNDQQRNPTTEFTTEADLLKRLERSA